MWHTGTARVCCIFLGGRRGIIICFNLFTQMYVKWALLGETFPFFFCAGNKSGTLVQWRSMKTDDDDDVVYGAMLQWSAGI